MLAMLAYVCVTAYHSTVMSKNNSEFPYRALGLRLRRVREHSQESLAEVSGAVEIELDALTDIEAGKARPSEDILMLLISHFSLKEDEAERMWELAGYEASTDGSQLGQSDTGSQAPQQTIMVMPGDVRIVYTDMLHIAVNDYGVVMNFLQGSGPKNPPLAIARVGMSREHAQSVLEVLQKTLAQSTPKQLPPATSRRKGSDQKPDGKRRRSSEEAK